MIRNFYKNNKYLCLQAVLHRDRGVLPVNLLKFFYIFSQKIAIVLLTKY